MNSSNRAAAGIEAQQPQGGGALAPGGEVERQSFHRDAPFAGAQVRKPDQPESEHRRGVAFGRAGDGRPSMLSVAQKGARKRRREADAPGSASALNSARFHSGNWRRRNRRKRSRNTRRPLRRPSSAPARRAEVEEKQLPFPPRKALHGQSPAGRGRLA